MPKKGAMGSIAWCRRQRCRPPVLLLWQDRTDPTLWRDETGQAYREGEPGFPSWSRWTTIMVTCEWADEEGERAPWETVATLAG